MEGRGGRRERERERGRRGRKKEREGEEREGGERERERERERLELERERERKRAAQMGCFHPRDAQALCSPTHHHFPPQSAPSTHFVQRVDVFYLNFQFS